MTTVSALTDTGQQLAHSTAQSIGAPATPASLVPGLAREAADIAARFTHVLALLAPVVGAVPHAAQAITHLVLTLQHRRAILVRVLSAFFAFARRYAAARAGVRGRS
jgi:hypothetical protein